MTEKFHEELEVLKRRVEQMGDLAKDMLENSVKSLREQDVELAEKVIANCVIIREMDQSIEEETLKLITLHQPMASDMRLVATILKLITYITRIGRYGNDIAKVAIELSGEPHIAKLVSLPQMSGIVCSMVDDALLAFRNQDLSSMDDFQEREDTIDAMRYSIYREGISYMMENPKYITRCTQYILIARYLERCGDHACKMAEKIHYMVTGQHKEIDHKPCCRPEQRNI
jgi:phosphate transport system protein